MKVGPFLAEDADEMEPVARPEAAVMAATAFQGRARGPAVSLRSGVRSVVGRELDVNEFESQQNASR